MSAADTPTPSGPYRLRRVGTSLIWGQIGRAADVGLGLIFAVLVVRALGPTPYAVYSVAWSIINTVLLLASLGYNEALGRFWPLWTLEQPRALGGLLRRLLAERAAILLLLALGVGLAGPLLAAWTRTPGLEAVLLSVCGLIFFQGMWEILLAQRIAALDLRHATLMRVLGQTLTLVLALGLFAVRGVTVAAPLTAALVSWALVVGLMCVQLLPQLRQPAAPADIGPVRRFGRTVWLTSLATFGLNNQIDTLLIAALISDRAQVSYYNVAFLILAKVYILLTGWGVIFMPSASEAYQRSGLPGLARTFHLALKVNMALLTPAFLFLLVWSQSLIELVFGPAYLPAARLLQVLCAFNLVTSLFGAGISHQVLYAADQQRSVLRIRVGAGALNILLDVLLIPHWGALGAIIGTSISSGISYLLEFGRAQRLSRAVWPVGVAVKLLIVGAAACLPGLLWPPQGWAALLLQAGLFGLIYLAGLRFTRLLTPEDFALLTLAAPRLAPWLASFAMKDTP